MINSLEDIAALLRGTELENSTKVKLDIPESSNCAFAIKVHAENSLRAWSILRSLVDETERYPVLAGEGSFASLNWTEYLIERDLFSRQEFQHEIYNAENRDFSPEALIERAKTKNLIQELEQHQQREYHFSLEDLINLGINYTSTRFGIAPSRESIFTSFQSQLRNVPHSVFVGVEKWLFDWEREQLDPEIALVPPDLQYLYLDWYVPVATLDYTLVLLPTANSWETLAYIHWFGAESSELTIALLQSWHERFKAELVAHDGLNLLFNVHQRPSTPEDAFQLAVEHDIFAGDTLHLSGISIRDHSRALLHLDRWCLLSKP